MGSNLLISEKNAVWYPSGLRLVCVWHLSGQRRQAVSQRGAVCPPEAIAGNCLSPRGYLDRIEGVVGVVSFGL